MADAQQQPVVVFDVGGVLVRICNTWQLAARSAGIPITLADEPALGLEGLPAFLDYQAGRADEAVYFEALGTHLGISAENALRVHNGILVEPYSGSLDLVRDLRARGIRVGILSNTNAPHWEYLLDPSHYPAVAEADMPMASHTVRLEKPDPAIYRRYEQEFSLQPEEIVYFDDNAGNVAAARQVGWRAHRIDPLGDTIAQISAILVTEGVLPAERDR